MQRRYFVKILCKLLYFLSLYNIGIGYILIKKLIGNDRKNCTLYYRFVPTNVNL